LFTYVLSSTVTFTGSIVAFAKLQGLVPSKEVSLPGKNVWNSVALGASLYLFFDFACVGAVGDAVGEFLFIFDGQ
jgi:NAD/NADP transhydrogenase beta subunit